MAAAVKPSEAIPLDHPRGGDPEYCCAGGHHNFHLRPDAPWRIGAVVQCCCKSLVSVIEAEEARHG